MNKPPASRPRTSARRAGSAEPKLILAVARVVRKEEPNGAGGRLKDLQDRGDAISEALFVDVRVERGAGGAGRPAGGFASGAP